MVLGPAEVSPGSVLELQVLKPCPVQLHQNICEWGHNLHFNKLKLENHCCKEVVFISCTEY